MTQYYSQGYPIVNAESLHEAAEIYGKIICRPIAYGDAATISALPDINTLLSVTETGYTQSNSGMVFSLRFEHPISSDGNDDAHQVLIFVTPRYRDPCKLTF